MKTKNSTHLELVHAHVIMTIRSSRILRLLAPAQSKRPRRFRLKMRGFGWRDRIYQTRLRTRLLAASARLAGLPQLPSPPVKESLEKGPSSSTLTPTRLLVNADLYPHPSEWALMGLGAILSIVALVLWRHRPTKPKLKRMLPTDHGDILSIAAPRLPLPRPLGPTPWRISPMGHGATLSIDLPIGLMESTKAISRQALIHKIRMLQSPARRPLRLRLAAGVIQLTAARILSLSGHRKTERPEKLVLCSLRPRNVLLRLPQ